MNSLRYFNSQARYIFAVAVLLLAALVVPVLALAAQVTERSISLSSSSASATNVSYTLDFTAAGAAGAFVVDFCSNSPVVSEACTAPAGFSASAATSTTVGFTDVSAIDANTVVVTGTIATAATVSVTLDNITNPSAAGPFYARILTYDTDTHADAYSAFTSGTSRTGSVDDGSVAISIADTIGVSGAVLESMLFCVSGVAISADCTSTTAPVLKLGEAVGDAVALVPTAVSTGNIYTQISTNASTGAVVSLKSSATDCGGLIRAGAPSECDILPALTGGITDGQAKFGVKTATATNTGTSPNGQFKAVTGSGYNTSTFALNYAIGNASGVTSTYGDPFLDTGDAPVNNKNVQLTFGASVSNSTPAGLYSTDLSLIATGKF